MIKLLEIYKFECFTAPCELQLFCNDKIKADQCAREILENSKRLESKYNYFDPDSYLSSINKRTTNSLDSESKSLLTRAKQYYKQTNGIFDITIATIKDIYSESNSIFELEEKKSQLLKYVGCEHFSIKKEKIYFDNDHTKIDLGGFVKEYSVDRAVSIIKKYKIKSALINFGGDIFAIGDKPNGEKFKIGITNPKEKNKHLFFISIENQALTTSASYERNKEIDSKKISHIISTKQTDLKPLSVTVVSDSCIESGVYSTALMCEDKLKTKNDKYIINDKLEISK